MSDGWDPMDYGKEYDWNVPFFEQYGKLLREIPWPSRAIENVKGSPYCNNGTNIKDSYLVFGSSNVEDSYYSYGLRHSKNVYDSIYVNESELNYEGAQNRKCYRAFYSNHCKNSDSIFFCKDSVNITNCFGCIGIKNKSYCVFNKQVSKNEYDSFIREADLGNYSSVEKWKKKSIEFWNTFPRKCMWGSNNANVAGEYIDNSKNVKDSHDIDNGENLRYCHHLALNTAKDCYDYFRFSNNSELIYESQGCGSNIAKLSFCFHCYPNCHSMTYSAHCFSSSDLWGCFGIKKKQYCVLNKQYTKEKYEKLVPRIIEHMNEVPYIDKRGMVYKYGEFFPSEFSPLAYNESIAQEYYPLSKADILKEGYRWADPTERNYKITITHDQLQENINDVDEKILDEVIGCSHEGKCLHNCVTAFKITPQELKFYKQFNIPLPRMCFPCRHQERMKFINSHKLSRRECMCDGKASRTSPPKADLPLAENAEPRTVYANATVHFHGDQPCPNDFQTSYSPERPEIVYCEQCYNSEVA